MITAVDTNIFLDIFLEGQKFYTQSKNLLEAHSMGALIISPLVYAELLTQFIKKFDAGAEQQLTANLQSLHVSVTPLTRSDLQTAAEAWNLWTRHRQDAVLCPQCGAKNNILCSNCGKRLSWRNHILTDFLIGAHAQNHANALLTRDRGFYKKYFKIKIIEQ